MVYTGGYDEKASAAATAVRSRVDAYEQFDLYPGWSGIDNAVRSAWTVVPDWRRLPAVSRS